MDRGSYVAASGGVLQMLKLDVIANNLANTNTPGFKRQQLVTEPTPFDRTIADQVTKHDPYAKADHELVVPVGAVTTITDFSPGSIQYTGNALNVALRGAKQFIAVQGEKGIEYTRAGDFTLNSTGELSTADGALVQGDGGAIIADGPGVKITEDGGVKVNGVNVGQLAAYEFDDLSQLTPVGNGRFRLADSAPQPTRVNGEFITGSIETANTTVVTSMLELISAARGFEMYTKTQQTIDGLNQTAISQVGRRV